MNRNVLLLVCASWPASAGAAEETCIPDEIARLVEKGACIQWSESGDLDKDGDADDLVLVLDKPKPSSAGPDDAGIHRALLILTAGPDGELRLAARNDKIIPCTTCWQTCGDPLAGLKAGPGTFTVVLESGCTAWQGKTRYTFAYSKKDTTWQLVRVREEEIYTYDRSRGNTITSTPPRDFGKIGIAGFDPDHWKGQGPR